MRNHILSLARQSFVYGLSGVALQAIGLITFPILAREFDPGTYGELEVAMAAFAVALTFVDFGLASAAQRSYYDFGTDDRRERGRVLFTAVVATTALAGVVAAVALVARDPLSEWLFDGEQLPAIVAVAALTIPIANLAAFLRQVMRLRFQAWHFVISSVLSSVVAAAVIVVSVVQFDLGVEGVFLGLLVGHGLAVLYGTAVVHREFVARLWTPELRRMLAFGLPLVPTALAMWALMLVDRLMLGRLAGLDDVGQYAAANRVVAVLLLGVTAFATAFGPYALSLYSEDRELEKRVRARALTYLTAALTLGALVLALFARELLALLAPGYDRAYQAVGLVALGAVSFGVSSVAMAGISFARRTGWFAVLTLGAAALNIGLNLILIPAFGMIGAAAATAIAFAALAAGHYVVSQRLYPTPYDPVRMVGIVALGAVFAPLGLVDVDREGVELLVKLAAVAAFLVSMRAVGVVRAGQLRAAIRGLAPSREAQA